MYLMYCITPFVLLMFNLLRQPVMALHACMYMYMNITGRARGTPLRPCTPLLWARSIC